MIEQPVRARFAVQNGLSLREHYYYSQQPLAILAAVIEVVLWGRCSSSLKVMNKIASNRFVFS